MLNARPILAAGCLLAALAAAPAAVQAQSGADSERFNRIENTMRSLTGQVEELTHQLRQLQDQLQRMQEDTNFRLSEIEGGGQGALPPAGGVAPLQGQTDTIGMAGTTAPLTNDSLQLGAPPQPLGTLGGDAQMQELPSGEQPLDLSTLAGGDASAMGGGGLQLPNDAMMGQPQMAAVVPTGDPRSDYDQAYGLIRSGRYDVAENAFRQFLASYPGDELAPEAQYWIGESLFARGEYGRAAEEFRAGYKAYPKSRRGPDTLLKLGLSMAGLGYRAEACQMYAATLKQYPDMSNGLKQRVITEQASAGC